MRTRRVPQFVGLRRRIQPAARLFRNPRGARPAAWAKRVAAAEAHGAGPVVAESNQGGEMVKEVLDVRGEGAVRVKLEHASKGKRDRPEPLSLPP